MLEPVREHGAHASARVRLEGLGEQAVAAAAGSGACRGRRGAAAPLVAPGPRSGQVVVALAGGSRRWARSTPTSGGAARTRRSRSDRLRRDRRAARRAGRARSTRCGGGPRPGSLAGCRRRRRRCCAGWCSARTSGSSEAVRTDFQRSGLAHLLAVSRPERVLLGHARARRRAWSPGSALRARLAVALALVALYVPLAGGGPSIQRAGRDGRRRAGGGARGAAGVALVRARARGGGHARAQPARVGRAGLAAVVRRRRRAARARRRAGARRCGAPGCPGRSPTPRRSRSPRRSPPRR